MLNRMVTSIFADLAVFKSIFSVGGPWARADLVSHDTYEVFEHSRQQGETCFRHFAPSVPTRGAPASISSHPPPLFEPCPLQSRS